MPEPLQGRHRSGENVIRLDTDICGLQHREELVFKRTSCMVGGLIGDVFLDLIQLGGADAERAVAVLPSKQVVGFSHPSTGVRLQGPYRVGQRRVRRQDHEYMDVVFRAADGEHLHAMIARNTRKVVPQAGLMGGTNELHTLFRAEDNVEDGTDVTMGHGSPVPPLKGLGK